jgi:BirA family biotin operon repressor/biotin-[acetyl-CoA-carboxylase] ligase
MVRIIRFDSLDSTNVKAREYPAGTVVVAAEQTAGRGRMGRTWSSEKGGIYLSLVLSSGVEDTKYLTITACVAVHKVLEDRLGIKTEIKWPNDLLLGGKKLCGILAEGFIQGNAAKMIVGIGINTNNTLGPGLRETGCSLRDLGLQVDNEMLVSAIADEFESLRKLPRKEILGEWRSASHTLGKKVRVAMSGGEISGIAEDIDDDCDLLIRTAQGLKKVREGDVSAL